jgi:hypothetical protein
MRFHRARQIGVVCLGFVMAGCFQFTHMNRDQSNRPETAMGSRAGVMMPGETSPPMTVFGQPTGSSSSSGSGGGGGGGSSSSQQNGPNQSGSSNQSGAPATGNDAGMTMLGGTVAESDVSTRDRRTPFVGPFLTLIGYPFWIFGKSNAEKADKAEGERGDDYAADQNMGPGVPRTPDDAERMRLQAENERIRQQLENRSKPSNAQRSSAPSAAGGSTISAELAALERSLGSRPPPEEPIATREGVDRNLDGRPDLWAVREDGRTQREELDDNHDGKTDRILYYNESNQLERSEEDLNGDGQMETYSHFREGEIARKRADTDGDGQADTWSFYEAGELVRNEVDRDRDGFRDLVMTYEDGELVREEDDRNRDGRPDLVSRYRAGEVVEKTEDLDYDGLPDITSYYENGRLTRRSVSSEGALDSWAPETGS